MESYIYTYTRIHIYIYIRISGKKQQKVNLGVQAASPDPCLHGFANPRHARVVHGTGSGGTGRDARVGKPVG